MTKYRTIVADPPWAYRETRVSDATTPANAVCRSCGGWRYCGRKADVCACPEPDWIAGKSALPYPSLATAEIAALPIADMACPNAHLYLWTTQRFLRPAFDVMEAWGFRQSSVLVWSKKPKGLGSPFVVSAEFVIVARRGSLSFTGSHMGTVFEWPRPSNRHSAKPDAFIDLVERLSPGPYLELFARRARFGWDYAGDGSLGTVQIPGLRAPDEVAA